MSDKNRELISRWRLVLGREAEQHGLYCDGQKMQRIESLVGYLLDEDTNKSGRQGSSGHSVLSIPEWIDGVNELFPNQAKEVMEKELVHRRGIDEFLDRPELLEKIEPNIELVKTILTHQGLLNKKTRVLARKIIEKVVKQLKEKMKIQVEQSITGAIRRDRHSPRPVFRNLDLKTTIRRNLVNYNPDTGKLLVDKVFFFAAERNKRPWHIIVLVDQSGSMLESAIFSTVMASIFYELPSVRTSLVLFDTQVVDLSAQVGQPVDVLMKVQLGGGTDITLGLQYTSQLVREPGKTIVVLISDFYEGRDERDLIRQTEEMSQSGIRLIGLGALGYDARPDYCRSTAKKLSKAGMDILSCTPEKLAECMARIISH